MLINVELPTGVTLKVESEWFYSMSDAQLQKFYENNTINFEYHQTVINPFNLSSLDNNPLNDLDPEIDIEELDISIDFIPDDDF